MTKVMMTTPYWIIRTFGPNWGRSVRGVVGGRIPKEFQKNIPSVNLTVTESSQQVPKTGMMLEWGWKFLFLLKIFSTFQSFFFFTWWACLWTKLGRYIHEIWISLFCQRKALRALAPSRFLGGKHLPGDLSYLSCTHKVAVLVSQFCSERIHS